MSEFAKKEENSLETPIVALCSGTMCSECNLVTKRLKQLAQEYPDIIFTRIDANSNQICDRAKVRSVPNVILIRGKSAKYWIKENAQSDTELKALVTNNIGTSATNSKRFVPALETAFHLESDNEEILQEFIRLSAVYRTYGCTFTYRKTESRSVIRAHYSRECSIEKEVDINSMRTFIDRNKFGDLHHYDWTEWKQESVQNPLAIWFTPDLIQEKDQKALQHLSKRKCGEIRFGWASAKPEGRILSLTGLGEDDPPLLFISNKVTANVSLVSFKPLWDHDNILLLNTINKSTNETVIYYREDVIKPTSPRLVLCAGLMFVTGITGFLITAPSHLVRRYSLPFR